MALSFTNSIARNVNRVREEINAKCYKISIELFLAIVRRTPSKTGPTKGPTAEGHLVNQWYPKAGPGFSSELSAAISPNGADSISRINSLRGGREFFKTDGRLSMTNNVHYAVRAEKKGWPKSEGWSGRIGPYRMVFLSIQEIKAKY